MSDLLDMQINRLEDAADLCAFRPLAARQVYAQGGSGAQRPNGLLTPYLREGEWWITKGFVDGKEIDGSGDRLPTLEPGDRLYIECAVSRQTAIEFTPEPTEADPTPDPVEYLTGAYSITSARLVIYSATEDPQDSGTFADTINFKHVFACDAEGNPPAGQSMPHQKIDRNSLSL
jgi:hypothetical protein